MFYWFGISFGLGTRVRQETVGNCLSYPVVGRSRGDTVRRHGSVGECGNGLEPLHQVPHTGDLCGTGDVCPCEVLPDVGPGDRSSRHVRGKRRVPCWEYLSRVLVQSESPLGPGTALVVRFPDDPDEVCVIRQHHGFDHAERRGAHRQIVDPDQVVARGSNEKWVFECDVDIRSRIRKEGDVLALRSTFVYSRRHSRFLCKDERKKPTKRKILQMWEPKQFH